MSCYDHDTSRSDLIGEVTFKVSDIINNEHPMSHVLINPKKQAKKKDYKGSGKLIITKCTVCILCVTKVLARAWF